LEAVHLRSPARRACTALSLILLIAACGDNVEAPPPPEVEAEDAEPLFLILFDALHEFHLDASFGQECADGGRIEMQVEANGDSRDLLHQFEGCAMDDYLFNGSLDYLRAGPCEGGGFSIDIVGELEIDGAHGGTCSFDLRERCRTLAGTACGLPIELP
jgi:hypothetical protein